MRDAATIVGTGDQAFAAASRTGRPRTRDQVAADLLVERLTGQATAAAVPLELHLVMTDRSLLGNDGLPAWLPGHGPLAARVARRLIAREGALFGRGHAGRDEAVADAAADVDGARLTLRRLYTEPETGQLVAMESRARIFPPLLRRMVTLRDDLCRTPFCDAPIRHLDHARPHRAGGATHWDNASGLCARCNLVKELPGWRHAADPGVLEVFSPAGLSVAAGTPPLLHGVILPRGGPPAHGEPARAPAAPLPAPRDLSHTRREPASMRRARGLKERRRRLRRARLPGRAAPSAPDGPRGDGPSGPHRRSSPAPAARSETMAG